MIKLGTVNFNGQQVYYKEQAADFVPFPTADGGYAVNSTIAGDIATDQIPKEFLNKTNQQLWDQYGVAIGGILAPATTGPNAPGHFDPRVNGILGPLAASLSPTYLTQLQLLSAKYTEYNKDTADYTLKYRYWDPNHIVTVTDPKTKVKTQQVVPAWVTVTETSMRKLHEGWNVLTINPPTDGGHVRTLLVYGDDTPPTFQLNTSGSPLLINQADIDNGSTYHISGNIVDASVGTKHFETTVVLNNFTPTDAKGNPLNHVEQIDANHIWVVFTIFDNAKNPYLVKIMVTVTKDATLLRDTGQKTITTVAASTTLQYVIQVIDAREAQPLIIGVIDPTKKPGTT